ncbi:hypothetical protein ACS3YM_05145 [Nocardia sp. N13]|uniref:hypothetical protein n=1 Tax=Nocardioides sp. N13(2025) TaxID=3453405 RepID=UPI003F7699A7
MSTRAESARQRTASSWFGRLGALLRREQGEEDGVFRPVRLPLWIDLGVSAGIILFMAGTFVGFFYWLAQTR